MFLWNHCLAKYSLGFIEWASHTAKTHESRTNYAHNSVSARNVRRMRNSSVYRTRTVIDCQWMCRRRRFVRDLNFWTVHKYSNLQLCIGVRYLCVGVRRLCVEYAWLCAVPASAVSAYASDLVRNCARSRPSTYAPPSYHTWTAHVSRSFLWRSRGMRVWTRSVSDLCVGRASNVRGILHRICSYASTCKMSAVRQWL